MNRPFLILLRGAVLLLSLAAIFLNSMMFQEMLRFDPIYRF